MIFKNKFYIALPAEFLCMPCNHRFIQDLYPSYRLNYLFVGTFNPAWNKPNGNNAKWFYGRRTNSFWRILPESFGHLNLNSSPNIENPKVWKEYCEKNGIGITDLIESIIDANENDHNQKVMSFLDEELETFKHIQFTNIPDIIKANSSTLCGVYLTRYCHTLNENSILFRRWNEIKILCKETNVHSACLITPSNGFMLPLKEKINIWKSTIKFCTNFNKLT